MRKAEKEDYLSFVAGYFAEGDRLACHGNEITGTGERVHGMAHFMLHYASDEQHFRLKASRDFERGRRYYSAFIMTRGRMLRLFAEILLHGQTAEAVLHWANDRTDRGPLKIAFRTKTEVGKGLTAEGEESSCQGVCVVFKKTWVDTGRYDHIFEAGVYIASFHPASREELDEAGR